jgi:hypothetical protein
MHTCLLLNSSIYVYRRQTERQTELTKLYKGCHISYRIHTYSTWNKLRESVGFQEVASAVLPQEDDMRVLVTVNTSHAVSNYYVQSRGATVCKYASAR